jgi:predicted PurR-regulated permease PerM
MESKQGQSKWTRFMLIAACFVVVVAGMRVATPILVPFLLSVFIVILCAPPLFWLQKKGVPETLAVLAILIGVIALFLILVALVGTSLNDFTRELPEYQRRLTGETAGMVTWLKTHGVEISSQMVTDFFNPAKVMRLTAQIFSGLSGALANGFLILLTVVFIMLEASGFPRKLQMAMDNADTALAGFGQFSTSVNQYIGIKTLFSLITGILIWLWLVILGVNHAILWGLLAFLLNYVPNIGSIIAAIPAVLLALVQLGATSALLTAAGYAVVNVVVGSIVEPRFMGKGLGLSTLVVFLSLVFWGWALGMVGMLLSVPLTMIFKIALESSAETRWIAVLLGSSPQVPPGGPLSEESKPTSSG